jgi:hypothetical protein
MAVVAASTKGGAMSQLSIRTEPDGDGLWRLWVNVLTDRFSGQGWGWGCLTDINEFASKLTTYPMPAGEPANFQLGYNGLQGNDLMVAVRIAPLGSLGTLEVRAEIADPDDATCRLKAKFFTSYAGLDRFSSQLRRLATGERTEAVLEGS